MKTWMKVLGGWLVIAMVGCGGDRSNDACPGTPLPQPAGLDPAVEARVDALVATMSLDEKVQEMRGLMLSNDLDTTWETGGTIPFEMIDGTRGVGLMPATSFPVGQARGAAWDRDLEQAIGEAIGAEAAAYGANVILAPAINVLRHPAWGRAQETYGEDTYEIGELGASFIQGAQQHVIATPKHFACNSIEDTRFNVSVNLDERALREVYLPQFHKAVAAGAGAFMTSYNKVNDTYASENAQLVREILKTDWGFQGFVMSDWILGTHSSAAAVRAGLDLEMPLGTHFVQLPADHESCDVSTAEIDDAVRRILRTKLRFGLDHPPARDTSQIESAAHDALALRAARESIVLLKNEGVLPLAPGGTIAIVGSLAKVANLGDKGSSNVVPSHAVSPLAGLQARFGARVVSIDRDTLDDASRATVAAASVVIVVAGYQYPDEGESIPGSTAGDRDSLALAAAQQALIADVAAANPKTIVVLEGGSAIVVEPWVQSVAGLLMAWYPGQEGGTALADILAGDVNPSGRLPVSFPVAESDLPVFDHTSLEVTYDLFHGYRYLDRNQTAPEFAFGYGLSYGRVTYDTLRVTADADTVHAVIQLTSVDRTGDEIVQLYVSPPGGAVPRAVRELRGFARVTLSPGLPATVTLDIPISDLARWDHGWVVDPGTWTVAVGSSSRDLPLTATFER